MCGFPNTSWPLINMGFNCVDQLEKNMHLSGPTQFKPLLLKSQLDWSRKGRKCSKAKHQCLPDKGEGWSELWPIWWHLVLLGPAMCAAPGKILICSAFLSSEVARWHTSSPWDLSRLLPKALGSYTISFSSLSPSSCKPTLCFCRSEARTGDCGYEGNFTLNFPICLLPSLWEFLPLLPPSTSCQQTSPSHRNFSWIPWGELRQVNISQRNQVSGET